MDLNALSCSCDCYWLSSDYQQHLKSCQATYAKSAVQDDAKAVLSNFTEVMEGSAVVLTVYGHKQLMAMEEFATLSVADFAKVYTVSLV